MGREKMYGCDWGGAAKVTGGGSHVGQVSWKKPSWRGNAGG